MRQLKILAVEADSFVRDLTFTCRGADLVADQGLSNGVRYEVRLSR
jgi:hypothetical protein